MPAQCTDLELVKQTFLSMQAQGMSSNIIRILCICYEPWVFSFPTRLSNNSSVNRNFWDFIFPK